MLCCIIWSKLVQYQPKCQAPNKLMQNRTIVTQQDKASPVNPTGIEFLKFQLIKRSGPCKATTLRFTGARKNIISTQPDNYKSTLGYDIEVINFLSHRQNKDRHMQRPKNPSLSVNPSVSNSLLYFGSKGQRSANKVGKHTCEYLPDLVPLVTKMNRLSPLSFRSQGALKKNQKSLLRSSNPVAFLNVVVRQLCNN